MIRKTLAVLTLGGLIAAGGSLYAQPSGDDADDADIAQPMATEAKLSSKAMTEKSSELVVEMKAVLRRVLELQQSARSQKDIIKLNCVNDKLVQVKQLLNIAESARNDLVEAIANRDESARYHHFSQITVAAENSGVLRNEAEACIGEELVFIGDTELEVETGDVQDDPTEDSPFDVPIDYDDVVVASPFR